MNRALLWLADLLAPNRCDCCGKQIVYDRLICEPCAEALSALRTDYAVWAAGTKHSDVPWVRGFSVYAYAGAAKAGILALKSGRRSFGRHAAGQLAAQLLAEQLQDQIDIVTWVPVTRLRQLEQGYAHSALLAKWIAQETGCRLCGGLLTEHAGRLRQHDLPHAERAAYAGRFRHTAQRLDGKIVLLCDDILTTGSTLRQCTQLLLEMGAKEVWIAVAEVAVKGAPR